MKMNRGEGKLYVIIGVLIVAAAVGVLIYMGPIYQRKWKMTAEMKDAIRMYDKIGEEQMYEYLIRKGKEIELPPLTAEDSFYFEGGTVGEPALLQCEYTEYIRLPGLKPYPRRILIEINIQKLPARSF